MAQLIKFFDARIVASWTPEEVEAAYDIFCKTLAIWRWMKKYDPREVAA